MSAPDNDIFDIYVFEDPLYQIPLVLAATLRLRPTTTFGLYQDRWSVEQMPLAAKHMTGAHRQFVFAPQSCQRWPELALIVGGILTYLAAALPPIPTGFWDKQPQATPGRLRRLLARTDFPKDYPFLPQVRKKCKGQQDVEHPNWRQCSALSPKPDAQRPRRAFRRRASERDMFNMSLTSTQVRKKQAVTDHLPKGVAAHRCSKAVT
jgi:hypothetical protein